MDDDAFRRGRPTVHVVFGEGIAVLAGDALLTAAFDALGGLGARAAEAARVLAGRAGARQLLRGQARDLEGRASAPATIADLERLHAEKTGALFAAAAELGGIAAGADAQAREALAAYGLALGVAFQHVDDLHDRDHPSFEADARRRVPALLADAERALGRFGARASRLVELARWVGTT